MKNIVHKMNQIIFVVFCSWLSVISSSYISPAYYYPQHHIPVLDHNGVPIDTPEVQAARKQHLAAVADAKSRAYGVHGLYHYAHAAPILHAPAVSAVYLKEHVALTPDGVPVDTADVQHAKAIHFKAHAAANARNAYGYGHLLHKRSVYAIAAPQHVPVIDSNGVPVDTPEVQHAKAAHFAAVAQAKARAAHAGPEPEPEHGALVKSYAPIALPAPALSHGHAISYNSIQAYPISHAQPIHAPALQKALPIHIPHIGPNGVPAETPEVQHAKAAHFTAVAEAKARNAKSEHVIPYPLTAHHW